MSDIDWTKAPPSTNAWLEGIWHKQQGSQCFYWDAESEIWRLTRLTPYGLSIILRRPDGKNHEPTPWTGDGLPPVGTVCEVADRFISGGESVRVVAHDEGGVVGRYLSGDNIGSYDHFIAGELVPIRTPEQIAEEERKAAGLELGELYVKGGLIAIYDAGWRPRAKS